MTDRPAAELLAEWKAALRDHKALFALMNASSEFEEGYLLGRLARAEQALAEIEALHTLDDEYGACDGCERQFPCGTIRAVRASQGGGQT